MPDHSWTCPSCREQNPPLTEACRSCLEPAPELARKVFPEPLSTNEILKASFALKIALFLNLAVLIAFMCFVVWQHLQSFSAGLVEITVTGGFLIFLCYRMIRGFRYPTTLDIYVSNTLTQALLAIAIVLIWVGVLSLVVFSLLTITRFFVSHLFGIGDLIVYAWLIVASVIGFIGLAIYEITRLMGHRALQRSSQ